MHTHGASERAATHTCPTRKQASHQPDILCGLTRTRDHHSRGNALFKQVVHSCGCHRAAAGLDSSRWNVAHKLARLALSNVADQGIGALAAEDMRWLWVLRNVWETVIVVTIVCSNSSKALDLVTRQHVISYARSLALSWDIHTM